jgi:hypothetical protein
MLAALVFRVITLYRRNVGHDRAMVALSAGFLSAWLLANVANSLWSDEKLPFVVLALVAIAWARPEPAQSASVFSNGNHAS